MSETTLETTTGLFLGASEAWLEEARRHERQARQLRYAAKAIFDAEAGHCFVDGDVVQFVRGVFIFSWRREA